ncbi:MAG: hypothetical protein Q7R97_01805, partial [Candidatus Daviesbacteria bacterium]|nr:hypothetical protein [Candidatus Daviesbacteria bacterium]
PPLSGNLNLAPAPATYSVRLYNGYVNNSAPYPSFTIDACLVGPNPKPWMQVFGDVHTNK